MDANNPDNPAVHAIELYHMAKIENSTLKAEFIRMADVLAKQGSNLTAEAVATVIVRTVIGELDPQYLEDTFVAERKELVTMLKPLITAPNNLQNVYLADTMREDGKTPVMPKVTSVKAAALAEFV